MRHARWILGLLLVATASFAPSISTGEEFVRQVPLPDFAPSAVIPDRFVVEFKRDVAHRLSVGPGANSRPQANVASVQRALDRVAATHAERQFAGARPQSPGSRFRDLTGYYLVSIPEGASLQAALDAMSAEPDVDHVEPIGVHPVDAAPNDPNYFYDEWHLWDVYGVDAEEAWAMQTGDPGVLVGILDTGVKYRHTDLGGVNPPGPADNATLGNVWVNPGEIPGNLVDDDDNGYVDDVIGYDFVANDNFLPQGWSCIDNDCGGLDNDPNDGHGHGTHVAGTVAAITNNGAYVAGVAGGFSGGNSSDPGSGCRIVPCRIGALAQNGPSTNGYVDMAAAAQAMDYLAGLVDMGFNVAAITCSWGSSNSGGIRAATDNLIAHDVMVITAAGNSPTGVASYLASRTDVMAVGATDQNGVGASFSNYGAWVDLAGPGVNVMSTWHNRLDPDTTHMYVASLNGTSMSTPHVVGVAALLECRNPTLSRTDKFNLLVNNTLPFNPANTKVLGSGIVNANLALAAAPVVVGVPAGFASAARTLALRPSPNPATSGSDLLLRALPGGLVKVAVVDASGRQVRALEGVAAADGSLRLRWDGKDAAGRRAGTGVYLVLAKAGGEQAAAKLVVLE